MTGSPAADDVLTQEEAELYDRQIRLWGVEAQQRLRKAKILVVGANGLGNEVMKNVLLAGVKHMTILDCSSLSADESSGQFLATNTSVGENRALACVPRARELNPMVDIVADTGDVHEKSEEFFRGFDVVCVTGESHKTQLHVNEICHRLGVNFLSGSVFGYYGYMFSDLGSHSFVEEKINTAPAAKKPRTGEAVDTEVEMVECKTQFCSLSEALGHNYAAEKSLRQLKQISKAYLVMRVLQAFAERPGGSGRAPKKMLSQQNVEELLEVRNDELERIGMDADMLNDEFACLCTGELYPVNAIVGGVLAQEVIKALSRKDRPHDNFFFYDGDATSGVVLRISPTEEEKVVVKDGVMEQKSNTCTNTIVDEVL